MKKHFIAALMALVLCLSVFTGCSVVKIFERDLQLVFKVNGEVQGVYTVNIFNSALVEAPKAPDGMTFYGWSPQENWEELSQDEVVVVPNKTYVMYNDVKDFIDGDQLSLTLYATFFVVPPKDLVVAWYRAEGVSTDTGLNEENMTSFTDNMYAYLEGKGYTPSDMDIVVRPYDGNVGTSCGTLREDGDVDIMVGWAANITSTGGMTGVKENVSGVEIGTISRYAARLNDKYLTRLVFVWILNTYGGQNLPEPNPDDVTPEPEPEPEPEPGDVTLPNYTVDASATFSLKIAWYAKTDTSGIEQTHIDALVDALKADLVKMGFTIANVTITTKGYTGNVGPSCAEIMADGDVDVMIGWGANISSTGNMQQGTDYLENVSGVTVGTISRYVTRVTDTDFTKIVFAWIQNMYGTAVDFPACFGWSPAPEQPDVPEDPGVTTTYKITIGWYSKTSTTGLDQEVMDAFTAALTTFIQSKYSLDDVTINIVDLKDGNVASVGEQVNAEGADFDMVFGMAGSLGGITVKGDYKQDGITMGKSTVKEGRNILIVDGSENELAIEVWNWLVGSNNDGWLYTEDAQQVGIYIPQT